MVKLPQGRLKAPEFIGRQRDLMVFLKTRALDPKPITLN